MGAAVDRYDVAKEESGDTASCSREVCAIRQQAQDVDGCVSVAYKSYAHDGDRATEGVAKTVLSLARQAPVSLAGDDRCEGGERAQQQNSCSVPGRVKRSVMRQYGRTRFCVDGEWYAQVQASGEVWQCGGLQQ